MHSWILVFALLTSHIAMASGERCLSDLSSRSTPQLADLYLALNNLFPGVHYNAERNVLSTDPDDPAVAAAIEDAAQAFAESPSEAARSLAVRTLSTLTEAIRLQNAPYAGSPAYDSILDGLNSLLGHVQSCTAASAVGTPSAVCVPLDRQIPFVATDLFASDTHFRAGNIPGSSAVGQVAVVGFPVISGDYQRTSPEGTFSMSLSITGKTASGFISIDPIMQHTIRYNLGQTVYPGAYPSTASQGVSSPCVSGVAFSFDARGMTLHNGRVYLYLNGTSSGYILNL